MAWFHRAKPGDRVVCVSLPTQASHPEFGLSPLILGRVYTIKEIAKRNWHRSGVALFLGFYGPAGDRRYTSVECFRPIQPKSTEASMAALRAHLNTKEVPEHA